MASGGAADPQSWNRYAYVQNDPVNSNDTNGPRVDYVGETSVSVGAGEGAETVSAGVYRWKDLMPDQQYWEDPLPHIARNRDFLDAAVMRAKALSESEDCQKVFGNAKTRADGFDPSSILDQIAACTFGTLKCEDKGTKWGVASVSSNGVPKLSSVTITINTYDDGENAYWNLGKTDFDDDNADYWQQAQRLERLEG